MGRAGDTNFKGSDSSESTVYSLYTVQALTGSYWLSKETYKSVIAFFFWGGGGHNTYGGNFIR